MQFITAVVVRNHVPVSTVTFYIQEADLWPYQHPVQTFCIVPSSQQSTFLFKKS